MQERLTSACAPMTSFSLIAFLIGLFIPNDTPAHALRDLLAGGGNGPRDLLPRADVSRGAFSVAEQHISSEEFHDTSSLLELVKKDRWNRRVAAHSAADVRVV